MQPEPILHFSTFRLDCTNEQLWQGSQLLPLRPKPFAVLSYLATHPNRLVTKEELLKAVWPGVRVSEGLLHTYVRDLRQILGKDPKAPRIIETVARRGYRFIAPLTTSQGKGFRGQVSVIPSQLTPETCSPIPALVGRDTELAQLQGWLDKALNGERQVVFVTGEPGIGKTTVVEAFLLGVGNQGTGNGEHKNEPLPQPIPAPRTPTPRFWLARGQCIEHYGSGEAYLPVLEALGRLCRESGNARLIELLGRHALAWLVQMPGLVGEAEFASLQQRMQGVTRERMLRKLGDALEVLTAERPLVLWLEDLQWSDYSTLDFLCHLARRREAVRLLVLGTYRPSDVILSGHPLKGVKQELHTHWQCVELPLGGLSEAAVTQYLEARFPGSAWPARLGPILYRSTEGSPLFLVNVVDYLVAQGWILEVEGKWELKAGGETAAGGVPVSLRQMIERQIERLAPEDRQMLEVASVAGMECATVTVAAGLQGEVEKVEERCEALARRGQFLHVARTEHWPDGTVSGRYRFIHALYQAVLYDRVAPARRVRLHRLIGERVEAGYGERAGEAAGELALHFERGQEKWRAIRYYNQAAEKATRRSAPREAIHHVRSALALLQTLPATRERAEQELQLQLALAEPLIATWGLAAPEVEAAYTRARALCEQLGDRELLFSVQLRLWMFHGARGELELTRSHGEEILHLVQHDQDPTYLLQAHLALGIPSMFLGSLSLAHEHFTKGSLLYCARPEMTQ